MASSGGVTVQMPMLEVEIEVDGVITTKVRAPGAPSASGTSRPSTVADHLRTVLSHFSVGSSAIEMGIAGRHGLFVSADGRHKGALARV